MELLTDPQAWLAFTTLLALEIVLGIDNVVFIAILAGKLPADQQAKARQLGLGLAAITRVMLLFTLAWMIKLTTPLFAVMGHELSGRDLILIGGGLFLIAKSTHEVHEKLEGEEGRKSAKVAATFASVIGQILLLDLVFSLDSIITAIGLVDELPIMVAAVLVAVGVMIAFAGIISRFVERHPTIKMLALSFLMLIGLSLMAEGFDVHVPKGMIYSAMGFSLFVETLNLRMRAKNQPVQLHQPYTQPTDNA
ncbi:MAG: TerC family protein [Gemmatimonadaceae bacterium]